MLLKNLIIEQFAFFKSEIYIHVRRSLERVHTKVSVVIASEEEWKTNKRKRLPLFTLYISGFLLWW